MATPEEIQAHIEETIAHSTHGYQRRVVSPPVVEKKKKAVATADADSTANALSKEEIE